jgi:hypothetical protein
VPIRFGSENQIFHLYMCRWLLKRHLSSFRMLIFDSKFPSWLLPSARNNKNEKRQLIFPAAVSPDQIEIRRVEHLND